MTTPTPASLTVDTVTREVTIVTVDGAKSSPHAFIQLVIDVGEPVGLVSIEVDASDWSRALAFPGAAQPATVATLERSPRGRLA